MDLAYFARSLQGHPHTIGHPMNDLLRRLLETISSFEFEEFGTHYLTAVEWKDDDVTLSLTLAQQENLDQFWRLRCHGVRRSRILSENDVYPLSVTRDHVVLIPYVEEGVDLFFSSPPRDPHTVIGELIEAHYAHVGAWFDCLKFFNVASQRSLLDVLAGRFGLLAQGPRSLMEHYATVMRGAGSLVSTPTQPCSKPQRADGTPGLNEPVAVLLGASYVVCSEVKAEIVDT